MTDPVEEQDLHAAAAEDEEVVDAIPVPEGAPLHAAPVQAPPRGSLIVSTPVAVQAAAVAVTGFAAGAVTVAAVRARRTRKAARSRGRKGGERRAGTEIRASRSFLVDIHLLSRD